MEKTIGGDRLGSGKRMKVDLHGYERSTHDLSFTWQNTQAPGTLVPFLKVVALPGDTFDISLNADVKTHPTVGPLFGSFKLQLDVFLCPIRLYNSLLHNNTLGLGRNIAQVKFPTITLTGEAVDATDNYPIDLQQISSSSLLNYLGIKGVCGASHDGPGGTVTRKFNALPILMYMDIFKNYYSNKQEEKAFIIDNTLPIITDADWIAAATQLVHYPGGAANVNNQVCSEGELHITGTNLNIGALTVGFSTKTGLQPLANRFKTIYINAAKTLVVAKDIIAPLTYGNLYVNEVGINPDLAQLSPSLTEFDLNNIDSMRTAIMQASQIVTFDLDDADIAPYNLLNEQLTDETNTKSKLPQQGLLVKTYQSDIFNNWVSTEFIDGVNGIADVTAIAVVDDKFTIDTLMLSKKVYDMLIRVNLAGGTYQDWLETVYDHEGFWKAETPIYCGGLSKEIVFQQIVSTAMADENNPLGSLAGQGVMAGKHKGGDIYIKVDEPSYIIGIVSITPRINYSQGNDWDVNLTGLDDLHKPALDGIGFQDLITEQMAWWDTYFEEDDTVTQFSAGKLPAWMNYMTNFNKAHGNFADPDNEMFMTLNRRYMPDGDYRIADLTTYIDPSKFNYAFALCDLSAMNFWTQISVDMIARRKMSYKIIPNL